MKCLVCHATWDDARGAGCPQCGVESAGGEAPDPGRIQRLREAFRARTTAYDPGRRVSLWDAVKPWLGVLLGFVLFVFWLRACSTMGWRLW